jgi:pimeloyl-ACP methyl ester carboxylesterase
VHFVNSKATSSDAIPLLFLHGWPGSFMEVMKALPALNEAGFNVVAPSLPGYGFSTYPDEAGFDHRKHAEVLNALMLRLGYDEYVVQGGD